MKRILKRSFFARPSPVVARDLLGKFLVRRTGEKEVALEITETEAYDGPHDLACHASKGRTARTETLFGDPGIWYVYLVYGMHFMLNVVTDRRDYPSGVLIRAAGQYIGPARLTKALAVNASFKGKKANLETGLWIEDRGVVYSDEAIEKGPRIGVHYAGPVWSKMPYRYYVHGKEKY